MGVPLCVPRDPESASDPYPASAPQAAWTVQAVAAWLDGLEIYPPETRAAYRTALLHSSTDGPALLSRLRAGGEDWLEDYLLGVGIESIHHLRFVARKFAEEVRASGAAAEAPPRKARAAGTVAPAAAAAGAPAASEGAGKAMPRAEDLGAGDDDQGGEEGLGDRLLGKCEEAAGVGDLVAEAGAGVADAAGAALEFADALTGGAAGEAAKSVLETIAANTEVVAQLLGPLLDILDRFPVLGPASVLIGKVLGAMAAVKAARESCQDLQVVIRRTVMVLAECQPPGREDPRGGQLSRLAGEVEGSLREALEMTERLGQRNWLSALMNGKSDQETFQEAAKQLIELANLLGSAAAGRAAAGVGKVREELERLQERLYDGSLFEVNNQARLKTLLKGRDLDDALAGELRWSPPRRAPARPAPAPPRPRAPAPPAGPPPTPPAGPPRPQRTPPPPQTPRPGRSWRESWPWRRR